MWKMSDLNEESSELVEQPETIGTIRRRKLVKCAKQTLGQGK